MTSFDFLNRLWELFSQDDEMISFLGIEREGDYELKIRLQNVMAEEYETRNIPFVACYFMESYDTLNDLVTSGYLCIEIYADYISTAAPIAKRIVRLIHKEFDLRIKCEGQFQSGVESVYKYRLVFNPLILS